MNVKRKRRVLNTAFKQFQRLPDMSRLNINVERKERAANGASEKMASFAVEPAVVARVLAE